MNNKKIIVSLRTQHENLGDLLIISLLIDELSKSNEVLLDVYGVPKEFYQGMLKNGVNTLQSQTNLTNCRSLKFLHWAFLNKRKFKTGIILSPGHLGALVGIKNQLRWVLLCISSLVSNSIRD